MESSFLESSPQLQAFLAPAYDPFMPGLAWKSLVEELMEEKKIKTQGKFADAINMHPMTVGRWLAEEPDLPKSKSINKIAVFLGVSPEAVRFRWAEHMRDLYAEYDSRGGESEVSEEAPTFDALRVVEQARALADLDLKAVIPEQAPSLHRMREHMGELANATETLTTVLRSVVSSYAAVYEGATDSAKRLKQS